MGRKRRNREQSKQLRTQQKEVKPSPQITPLHSELGRAGYFSQPKPKAEENIKKLLEMIERQAWQQIQDFTYKKSLAAIPPTTEIDALRVELTRFSTDNPDCSSDRTCYLGENHERTKVIGERLNQLGGFALMQQVNDAVPIIDQRELDYAWDGVGEWRC